MILCLYAKSAETILDCPDTNTQWTTLYYSLVTSGSAGLTEATPAVNPSE